MLPFQGLLRALSIVTCKANQGILTESSQNRTFKGDIGESYFPEESQEAILHTQGYYNTRTETEQPRTERSKDKKPKKVVIMFSMGSGQTEELFELAKDSKKPKVPIIILKDDQVIVRKTENTDLILKLQNEIRDNLDKFSNNHTKVQFENLYIVIEAE